MPQTYSRKGYGAEDQRYHKHQEEHQAMLPYSLEREESTYCEEEYSEHHEREPRVVDDKEYAVEAGLLVVVSLEYRERLRTGGMVDARDHIHAVDRDFAEILLRRDAVVVIFSTELLEFH